MLLYYIIENLHLEMLLYYIIENLHLEMLLTGIIPPQTPIGSCLVYAKYCPSVNT